MKNIFSSNMTIEQMITSFFVRYDHLRELVNEAYKDSKADKLNIFIDLNSVLKVLYSIDAWTYKVNDPLEITASVINMCVHYRSFFNYMGVATNFHIIYGLNCPSMIREFVSGYNDKFIKQYAKKDDITELINSNLKALYILCPYLPGIYFYDIFDCEVSSMIDYILRYVKAEENKDIEQLIITKDILALQLIGSHNIKILRPYKTKDDNGQLTDASYIITKDNLYHHLAVDYYKVKAPTEYISPTLIENLMPMVRVDERNLTTIKPFGQVYSIFKAGMDMGYIEDGKLYTQPAINNVLDLLGVSHNPTEFELRYKAINPRFHSMYIIPNACPQYRTLNFADLMDVNGLHAIIQKWFTKIPINIDKL